MKTEIISSKKTYTTGRLVKSATKTFKVTVPERGPYAGCSFVFRASGRPAQIGDGDWKMDVWSGGSHQWNPFAEACEIPFLDPQADMDKDVDKNIERMVEHAETFVIKVTP